MNKPRILHVVGARPNFMKVGPIMSALSDAPVTQVLVHTGQHYDRAMSELFFEQLKMPRPDVNLGVGSGSHGEQTGRIMAAFEPVLQEVQPDLVVVAGDVNSTLACTLDAKKLGVPVAHVEAGLRSGDMSMPEEINRIATDALSDLLFTTDRGASANLRAQGVPGERIFFVGNVMIDSLLRHRRHALEQPTLAHLELLEGTGAPIPYGVITLHRPANVDAPARLNGIVAALERVAQDMVLVFPVHPRTRARLDASGLQERLGTAGVRLVEPLGYLDFLNLNARAQVVFTDSGGIQEETTILGVPCLTLRENTERPVTLEQGTNRLVGVQTERIIAAYEAVRRGGRRGGDTPELWDGHSAERIAGVMCDWLGAR